MLMFVFAVCGILWGFLWCTEKRDGFGSRWGSDCGSFEWVLDSELMRPGAGSVGWRVVLRAFGLQVRVGVVGFCVR